MSETETAPVETTAPRGTSKLHLESAPLHTESPKWAAHAPEQVEACLKRGAHVIGWTEVIAGRGVADDLRKLCKQYGYTFIHGTGDTALAVKGGIKILDSQGFVHVAGSRGYSSVTFEFNGSHVTVFMQHWGTNVPAHHDVRVAQNKALIAAMHEAAQGKRLAFYMGDANPDGPLSHPDTFPRKDFDQAGLPLVYEALGFLQHIGVNFIGWNKADHRVTPHHVEVFPALGSDHYPVHVIVEIVDPLRQQETLTSQE